MFDLLDKISEHSDYLTDIEDLMYQAMDEVKKIFELIGNSNILDKIK